MPRRKVQPAKLITEANQNLVLANLLKEDLLKTQTRLLFNFDQIEKKYCRSSSGITYSTTDDEVKSKNCTRIIFSNVFHSTKS